ncbi:MAG: 4Fe-4S binding protein [Desulfobacula sp.]|nr:4Fe-4S binding protein [Desulfobacula sp.]
MNLINNHLYSSWELICMGCGFCASDCPVDAIANGPRIMGT